MKKPFSTWGLEPRTVAWYTLVSPEPGGSSSVMLTELAPSTVRVSVACPDSCGKQDQFCV
jgi:hypothetical protein